MCFRKQEYSSSKDHLSKCFFRSSAFPRTYYKALNLLRYNLELIELISNLHEDLLDLEVVHHRDIIGEFWQRVSFLLGDELHKLLE